MLEGANWGAVATGVFIGLAIQTVLLLSGMAVVRSVGDRLPGTGYQVWAVVSVLLGVAIGAALAASLSHIARRASGAAVGVLTWSITLVLGAVVSGIAIAPRIDGAGAWAPLFGAVLGLAAAMFGGGFAATLHGPVVHEDHETDLPAHPVH